MSKVKVRTQSRALHAALRDAGMKKKKAARSPTRSTPPTPPPNAHNNGRKPDGRAARQRP